MVEILFICWAKKICGYFKTGEFDFFFSIVIKENTFRLQRFLAQKYEIADNHEKIIENLKKYKEKNFAKKDAFSFFVNILNNYKKVKKNILKNPFIQNKTQIVILIYNWLMRHLFVWDFIVNNII